MFMSASLTGFHPFKRNCSQQQCALRSGIFRGKRSGAETEVENHPNFQRGQVQPCINVSHLHDRDIG